MRKVVGLTVGRKYDNYANWFKEAQDVDIVPLSFENKNADAVKSCQGIVFTGGEDVHPRFYNNAGYVDKFRLDDLNEHRDEFELSIMNLANRQRLPVLGICRGLQLVNVFFGGTLVPDIRFFGRSDHTKMQEGSDRHHPVWLVENSQLESITGTRKGEVNSAHHQSADQVAEPLMMNAVSPDGVIEGLERKIKKRHPYLMLVQWHPERMANKEDPFSRNIRDSFLKAL